MNRRARLKDIEAGIKNACDASDDEFLCKYLGSAWSTTWDHPQSEKAYNLTLSQSTKTSEDDLEACFSLIEETSKTDYEASSRGWNPISKKVEMRDPDLRYILVKDLTTTDGNTICGFTSLMPTMEDGEAVIYCYEIHLKPGLRGTGLAALLIGFLETAATNIQVMEKVMLTVFVSNHRALAFYRRRGFEVDESSPRPRKLRGGVVKNPDYAIMSIDIAKRRAAVAAAAAVTRAENGFQIDSSLKDGTPPILPLNRPAKVAKLDQGDNGQPESAFTVNITDNV